MLGRQLIHDGRHDRECGVAQSTTIQCDDRKISDGVHDCGTADWATDR
jgi:hypothetical protein